VLFIEFSAFSARLTLLERTIAKDRCVCLSVYHTHEPRKRGSVQVIEIHFAPYDRAMFLVDRCQMLYSCV